MLPLVWVFIAALARGADDASQTWKAFAGFAYFKVWMSALVVGIGLVALNWVIWWLMGVTASRGSAVLPGRFLESTGAQAWMVTAAAGICYFPLLVLQPALSLTEARRPSRDANDINGRRTISWLIVGMMCVLAPFSLFVPAFGMTTAAWIVFMGILNYVAYRDIFERRSANLPETVATASAVVAAHATEQCRAFANRYFTLRGLRIADTDQRPKWGQGIDRIRHQRCRNGIVIAIPPSGENCSRLRWNRFHVPVESAFMMRWKP
jgi:hypothetical protein